MNSERDDDGLSHLNNPERRNWDKELCDTLADGHSIMIGEGNIPASLNFALTRHEARYLRAKFRSLALREGRPSILSHERGTELASTARRAESGGTGPGGTHRARALGERRLGRADSTPLSCT